VFNVWFSHTFLDGFGRNLAQRKMMMDRCACDWDFPVRRFFKELCPLAYFINIPCERNHILCILAEGFSVHCTSILSLVSMAHPFTHILTPLLTLGQGQGNFWRVLDGFKFAFNVWFSLLTTLLNHSNVVYIFCKHGSSIHTHPCTPPHPGARLLLVSSLVILYV
jgi:hypothetical protein